jgi:lactam utilization protein B
MERPVYVPTGQVGHEINYMQFHDAIEEVKQRVVASEEEVITLMVKLIDVMHQTGCTLGDATDALYRLATIRRTLRQCMEELPVTISMLN